MVAVLLTESAAHRLLEDWKRSLESAAEGTTVFLLVSDTLKKTTDTLNMCAEFMGKLLGRDCIKTYFQFCFPHLRLAPMSKEFVTTAVIPHWLPEAVPQGESPYLAIQCRGLFCIPGDPLSGLTQAHRSSIIDWQGQGVELPKSEKAKPLNAEDNLHIYFTPNLVVDDASSYRCEMTMTCIKYSNGKRGVATHLMGSVMGSGTPVFCPGKYFNSKLSHL